MSKTSYLRFTTSGEDDVLPVVYWFIGSHLLGMLAFEVSSWLFAWLGHTSPVTVPIVGGGSVMYMNMPAFDLLAMKVQGAVFLLSFGGCALYDRLHS